MAYPHATQRQVEHFRAHGWLVVESAIESSEIDYLDAKCREILRRKEELAKDWVWEKGRGRNERSFRVLQANPRAVIPHIESMEFQKWAISFASSLMGEAAGFWYDQYIAKPPRDGAETYWHQDEAYWGKDLYDKGVTCWMPFQDVDPENGCMHFVDRGHHDGILEHARPEHTKSDLIYCEPDLSRMVACPIKRGAVTFHHGKTPHMTTPNRSERWRQAITTHMSIGGVKHGGNYYSWYVAVDQRTGKERTGEELEAYSRRKFVR